MRDLLNAEEKSDFNPVRHGILDPDTLSLEDRNQLIKENPAYGNIICRCEMITEGEILDAIHRPLGARSLDGVKRRTRAAWGVASQDSVPQRLWRFWKEKSRCRLIKLEKTALDRNLS